MAERSFGGGGTRLSTLFLHSPDEVMARVSRMLGQGFVESMSHSSIVGSFFTSSIVLLSISERRIPIFRLATYLVVRSLETSQERILPASVPLLKSARNPESTRPALGNTDDDPRSSIMTRRLFVYR